MPNTSNANTATSSGTRRCRLKDGVDRWHRTWAGIEVEPRAAGTILESDPENHIYRVLWDGHTRVVVVGMEHVEVLAPGEEALLAEPRRSSRMFK